MLTEAETKKKFDDPAIQLIARANAQRIFDGQRLKFYAELTPQQAALISHCDAIQYIYDETVLNLSKQCVVHHQELCRLEAVNVELRNIRASRIAESIPEKI